MPSNDVTEEDKVSVSRVSVLRPHVDESAPQNKVVEAAIRCFEKHGPHRTSMADIAFEAGISRPTLYRVIDGRTKLIDLVILKLFRGIREEVEEIIGQIEDEREAVLDGILISIELAQKDNLLDEVIREATQGNAEHSLFHLNDPWRDHTHEFWGPILSRGRAKGRIRTSLSDDRIYELMMNFHAILLLRSDIDRDVRRALLKDMFGGAFLD